MDLALSIFSNAFTAILSEDRTDHSCYLIATLCISLKPLLAQNPDGDVI